MWFNPLVFVKALRMKKAQVTAMCSFSVKSSSNSNLTVLTDNVSRSYRTLQFVQCYCFPGFISPAAPSVRNAQTNTFSCLSVKRQLQPSCRKSFPIPSLQQSVNNCCTVLISTSQRRDFSEHAELLYVMNSQISTQGEETREINMLYLLGIITGLLFVIIWFSKGLKESNKAKKQRIESSANNKKRDLSERDVNLLAKILSVGLVDADPDYVNHLKEFRDLKGT